MTKYVTGVKVRKCRCHRLSLLIPLGEVALGGGPEALKVPGRTVAGRTVAGGTVAGGTVAQPLIGVPPAP
jgi:hypothetical protein